MTGIELQDKIAQLRTTQAEVARRCKWSRGYVNQLTEAKFIPDKAMLKLDVALADIKDELLMDLAGAKRNEVPA